MDHMAKSTPNHEALTRPIPACSTLKSRDLADSRAAAWNTALDFIDFGIDQAGKSIP